MIFFLSLSSSNPFLISVTCGRSISASFDWGILIHPAQSVFLSLIYIWSWTGSKFTFRKRYAHAGSINGRGDDEHDAPARNNFDFVLSEIPLNLSHVFLAAHSHAARAFFPGMMIDSSLICMTEMIPCWCSLGIFFFFCGGLVEERVHRAECCVRPNSPPDVTICPSDCSLSAEWCAASTCLQSAFGGG